MSKQIKLLSCLLFCLFLLVSIGSAQERGSVRGLVKSDAGQALENATVVISGPVLPMGREYLTGKDGSFIFQALPPGKYTLIVTHPEMIDFTAEVIVAVARETFVDRKSVV